jgi:glycosyltransferase involved in cell wall biosynthesis
MPTYNDGRYIAAAIDSVLAQGYGSFELLVCDDGSTDETAQVVRGFEDARIRYFTLPHRNANVARNHGVQQAQGEYVAFIDSDDRWLPNHLSVCLSALRRQACDGVYSGMMCERPNGDVVKLPNVLPAEDETFVDFMLRTATSTQTDGLFLTTCSARDTGWDNELLRHQDYDFVARYVKKYRFLPTGEHTFIYYRHVEKKRNNAELSSCVKFIERHRGSITPNAHYRLYLKYMLRLAKSLKAEEHILEFYHNELKQC